MGLVRAVGGAVAGTFGDQWKDIITAGPFTELTVVAPGTLQRSNAGRGSNYFGSEGVISNGSKIFIPEKAAAVVFSESGIEEIVAQSGSYEYQSGQASMFNGDGVGRSIVGQVKDRVGYGGQTADQKRIAFVNLREIRGVKFGTRGPLLYHDLFYESDLEVLAFGSFSVQVEDVGRFLQNFVPPNVEFYSFDSEQARAQISAEFLQSLIDALNALSTEYRISQLPSQAEEVAALIAGDVSHAGTWRERFGLRVVAVGIENIELTAESRQLVQQYSSNRMELKAYEGLSQSASNIGAQQKIAEGIQDHGLGDGGGLVFGMGFAQSIAPQNAAPLPAGSALPGEPHNGPAVEPAALSPPPPPPPPPTSAAAGPTVAAGWYTDPWGAQQGNAGNLRWWDGARWTGHVSPPPTT